MPHKLVKNEGTMGKYSSRRTLSIELESKITIDQADILSKDKEVCDQIVGMCKRLAPMQIDRLILIG